MNVIIVTGAPGSGKTYFANKLLEKLEDGYLIDDISINPKLIHIIHSNTKNLIVTDPLIIMKSRQKVTSFFYRNLKDMEIIFSWYFIKSNFNLCKQNINKRNDDRIISYFFLNSFFNNQDSQIDKFSHDILENDESITILYDSDF